MYIQDAWNVKNNLGQQNGSVLAVEMVGDEIRTLEQAGWRTWKKEGDEWVDQGLENKETDNLPPDLSSSILDEPVSDFVKDESTVSDQMKTTTASTTTSASKSLNFPDFEQADNLTREKVEDVLKVLEPNMKEQVQNSGLNMDVESDVAKIRDLLDKKEWFAGENNKEDEELAALELKLRITDLTRFYKLLIDLDLGSLVKGNN